MKTIDANQLKDAPFEGPTVFMVHLKEEKDHWKSVVPTTIVRTSHSLVFWGVRKGFRVQSKSANPFKIGLLLDQLIPDEPDTASQQERMMVFMNSLSRRSDSKENPPALQVPENSAGKHPKYRDAVITLVTLAKKEACAPNDLRAVEVVLEKFKPYYPILKTTLDRTKLLDYVIQTLELSLPKEGVLAEYDFADQIWLPAIDEQVPLEEINTLLIEVNPGFYQAEKKMVERWERSGTQVIEVIPEPPRPRISSINP